MYAPSTYVENYFGFEAEEASEARQQYNFERRHLVRKELDEGPLDLLNAIAVLKGGEGSMTNIVAANDRHKKHDDALKHEEIAKDYFFMPTPAGTAAVEFQSRNLEDASIHGRYRTVLADRRWQVVRNALQNGRIAQLANDIE